MEMRAYKTVYMRGGTSKGCMFRREDLPADQKEWDEIFLKVMGNPDPKQIDGMGGTVSSNNKIVVVWESDLPDFDIEYLVGQVIVGEERIDYKANCGNMTAAVGPFAVEEKMVTISQPITTVRLLNQNTRKHINIKVPIDPETNTFAEKGDCRIAGIDGTAAEVLVNFVNPAGAKTGKLFPTGERKEPFVLPDGRVIDISVLDVGGPLVIVHAGVVGSSGTEMPEVLSGNAELSDLVEYIRGNISIKLGFAKDLEDAIVNSPGVPKIALVSNPQTYVDIAKQPVTESEMDICARVYSIFKCHKAIPVTAACGISVAALFEGTIVQAITGKVEATNGVRIGHPSGGMKIFPKVDLEKNDVQEVGVQRTARRIMDGRVYIPD